MGKNKSKLKIGLKTTLSRSSSLKVEPTQFAHLSRKFAMFLESEAQSDIQLLKMQKCSLKDTSHPKVVKHHESEAKSSLQLLKKQKRSFKGASRLNIVAVHFAKSQCEKKMTAKNSGPTTRAKIITGLPNHESSDAEVQSEKKMNKIQTTSSYSKRHQLTTNNDSTLQKLKKIGRIQKRANAVTAKASGNDFAWSSNFDTGKCLLKSSELNNTISSTITTEYCVKNAAGNILGKDECETMCAKVNMENRKETVGELNLKKWKKKVNEMDVKRCKEAKTELDLEKCQKIITELCLGKAKVKERVAELNVEKYIAGKLDFEKGITECSMTAATDMIAVEGEQSVANCGVISS